MKLNFYKRNFFMKTHSFKCLCKKIIIYICTFRLWFSIDKVFLIYFFFYKAGKIEWKNFWRTIYKYMYILNTWWDYLFYYIGWLHNFMPGDLKTIIKSFIHLLYIHNFFGSKLIEWQRIFFKEIFDVLHWSDTLVIPFKLLCRHWNTYMKVWWRSSFRFCTTYDLELSMRNITPFRLVKIWCILQRWSNT